MLLKKEREGVAKRAAQGISSQSCGGHGERGNAKQRRRATEAANKDVSEWWTKDAKVNSQVQPDLT